MWNYLTPAYLVLGAFAGVVLYDAVVGTRAFINWSQSKGLQSLLALGLLAAAFCTGAGIIYGIWGSLDENSQLFVVGTLLTFICWFPLIDFGLKVNRGEKGAWAGVLFVILGIGVWFLVTLTFFQCG